MAGWLAKERDGKEVIFKYKPKRETFTGRWSDSKYHFESDHNYQGTYHVVYDHHNSRIILPKGTIEKIIGKKLKWKDEPVKFK